MDIAVQTLSVKPADHEWISRTGRPWSLRVKSDLCARCGRTPDVHPPDWTLEDVTDEVLRRLEAFDALEPRSNLVEQLRARMIDRSPWI